MAKTIWVTERMVRMMKVKSEKLKVKSWELLFKLIESKESFEAKSCQLTAFKNGWIIA